MSGGTILVCEDSRLMRAVIRSQLESTYVVVEAQDGHEALLAARRELPDVILCDVEMPLLDGYGVLDAIQADRELSTIPVVFLTGRGTAEDVAEGLRRGAHDYLRKPFEESELLARVHAAMRTKGLQDALRARNVELERMVSTDGLTGVFNRRFLDTHARRLLSRSHRHGIPLALYVVDIDHFKHINDTYGHPVGDAVIVEVAGRLLRRLRAEDTFGRWGGEEFMVITPDTPAAGAATLAEALRAVIAAEPVSAGRHRLDVTVSVGWASWVSGETLEGLIKRADDALYDAKHAGRDAVRGG